VHTVIGNMINTSKPTTTYTNSDKVAIYETWATIITTWATEIRTWADMASIMDNDSKPSTSISNVSKP
jgi:hypothetical protein